MEAKTNESSAAEAASTGQLLRRYRKLAGLTAQELAHEVNSKHPDDAITAAVVFNIEAERKTAITIPELAHFAEVLAISPIQLLCDCDQPYLPAHSGAFQGKTARQVIEEFTLPREPRNDAPTSVIATVLNLEENLHSILNLGGTIHDMPGGTNPAMNGVACQLAEIRGRMLASQIRQLQAANVRLPDKTSAAVDKARQILRRLELKATKSNNGPAEDNWSIQRKSRHEPSREASVW
ncbi:helix-turn-helix domain-containing protein [Bifidobacterium longum]|uniref:Helix-turn-helix domain-containing protein n=1 Tax=Bifidobacterium longum TaxID=216816 RepID=A0AAW4NM77_BIFLN|nr:helix-turn-helix transcriptional regulator [Bifidobacterium longum]MBV3437829.1 helix-turn-helix domain-containing protein [Bifidobacterium longum]MBV3494360.1 helix-turn-helix domain-containing protein [Bifidobacterium longum]MBV3533791.1 helix-turn-helix domain-containing protein [Bifidobacterium longum]MBV3539678.1 helix-turn-helix domain-containing protein [Bifidobacterium longum]MBV3542454.1 helix-turn-helix domain-containing protein [Bifidobacterium longum]